MSKWLFFPSPAAGGLGDLIVTNGIANLNIGGVESRIQSDGSSTVHGSWTLGNMDFRDASKNAAWTDNGLGLLWGMIDSTNYNRWTDRTGSGGGTFSVYETGTTTLIFSFEWAGASVFTANMQRYGTTSIDFTGDTATANERVDVYHVQA